jgi:hypothetical protein
MKTSEVDQVVAQAIDPVSHEQVAAQLQELAHLHKSELDDLADDFDRELSA